MKYILLVLSLSVNYILVAQSGPIYIDDQFTDWEEIDILYADPADDQGNTSIDFGNFRMSNSEDFLFFQLETGAEINLQDLNNITLYLDTDNDPGTGWSLEGIGVELEFTFGQRKGQTNINGNVYEIFHNDIGLVTSPTVTSTQFEWAISLDASIGGQLFFESDEIRVVIKDASFLVGDEIPNESGGLLYTFSANSENVLPDYTISSPIDSDFRLVSWNIHRDDFFESERLPSYTRIFQAVMPDIIAFQEIYDHSSLQTANRISSILPGQQWYHKKVNPDIIVVSKYPIISSQSIPGVYQEQANGAFLLDMGDTEFLLINAHTPCCDNNIDRQKEVDAIMAFLRETKAGNTSIEMSMNTPVVITGDFNLVGDRQQLQTLYNGDIQFEALYGNDFAPDWDDSDLEVALPFTTGLPMSFSWYNPFSSFSPGRLDFFFYSGSVLNLLNNYILFTPALPQDSLIEYNLQENDVVIASDHLPLVADFLHEPSLSVSPPQSFSGYFMGDGFPNPSSEIVSVNYQIPERCRVKFNLYDSEGKFLQTLLDEDAAAGEYTFSLEGSHLPKGTYYCQMQACRFTAVRKLVF
ncbi:MAG: hypothetical protein GY705_04270 [Bacteroidetes bacterium]|nr:hypothetical protein [Bacteroidota bacterium]